MTTPWAADEGMRDSGHAPRRSRTGRIVAGVILLLVAGFGVFSYLLFRAPQGVSVSLGFDAPPATLLGEPFSLSLSLGNDSNEVLYAAKLSIFLPQDVAFVGEWSKERVHDEVLGTVGPGSVTQKTVNLVSLGDPNSVRQVRAKFVYSTSADTKVQFEKEALADVKVGEPALSLSLETPKQVVNGVPFTITLKYRNQSHVDFKNVRFMLRYPPVFQFRKASVDPSTRKNDTWNFEVLKGGEEGEISLEGAVVGPEGSFFTLGVSAQADYLGESREVAAQTASIAVASAPLSASITVNGGSDYIATIGETLQYDITYRNNSSIVFRGITATARLVGTLFDYSSVSTKGSFNSLTNTVSWIAANEPELLNLNPGESKILHFTARLKSAFPITRVSDKNYVVKVEARVESPTVPSDTATETTVSLASIETKVAGNISLHAKALFKDAAWQVVNTGPYPPRVNQPTRYSIHWVITNYATDAGAVHVEAYLQSGAKFLGQAKSTGATLPQYDVSTGRVTWDIPSIAATRGIVGPPVESMFQIEATPSITQAGSDIVLLGDSKLQANDLFTGKKMESAAPQVKSDLPEDSGIPTQDRRVQN